eukprot:Skav215463  [mRNA]  locus=scaffold1089:90294:94250:- [translate_table: standard]
MLRQIADAAAATVATGTARAATATGKATGRRSEVEGGATPEAAERRRLTLGKDRDRDRRRRERSRATYKGQWKGNQRHGLGKQEWPDGAAFTGQWRENYAEATTESAWTRRGDDSRQVVVKDVDVLPK